MRSFFKIFFASCLSLIVFFAILMLVFFGVIYTLVSSDKPEIKSTSVLVLDLGKTYHEQQSDGPMAFIQNRSAGSVPGIYDVVRMLDYAKGDSSIKGLYIKATTNPNGFGTSEELRKAVLNFKESGKFVIAYGETMDQKSYYVASAAQQVYCHPGGGLDWRGLSISYTFYKGLLDKLDIRAQVFFAGKFKSATEPLRVNKMTEPNRIQTTDLLNDIYGNFLTNTAEARNSDTAQLHRLANEGAIQTAADAVNAHLIDGALYDDEVKDILLKRLHLKESDKINFVSLEDYGQAVSYKTSKGDKIAILYAEGDIVDGKSDASQTIASQNYIAQIRKLRFDKDIKAVVFRVNSPGGSALASDGIWREVALLKKEKPVVVSMGDYAASGGYYIACAADSIFAEPGTLTGSIGVFGVMPDLQQFFNNKLGITFDGVKTAPYADMGAISRPLTAPEQQIMQASIDTMYHTFKSRVAGGRKLDMAFVDNIAQGHVYTGKRAIEIKLVDRIGYISDAVRSAAAMAKLSIFQIKEYPAKKSFLQQLMSGDADIPFAKNRLRETVGEEQLKYYEQLRSLEQLTKGKQARLMMIPEIN